MSLAIQKKELKAQITAERERPAAQGWALTITAITFLLLYIPLVAVVVLSFRGDITEPGWTLEWYKQAFTNADLLSALWMSLVVGIGSTILATVIGTLAAFALERARFPGKKIFDALNLVPLVMPEIVLGLALLIWFVFLNFSLGSVSMILAHTTFCLSFVIITVRARLHQFDLSVEEAARDLGANSFQTFMRITLPLIWPGILSGALLAFTLSFDDFLIAYFTAGVGSDTLPIKLYSMIKFGINPTVNAMSTLVLVATVFLIIFMTRYNEKHKTKQGH